MNFSQNKNLTELQFRTKDVGSQITASISLEINEKCLEIVKLVKGIFHDVWERDGGSCFILSEVNEVQASQQSWLSISVIGTRKV